MNCSIIIAVCVCRLVITPLTEQSWWTWDFAKPWGKMTGTVSSFMTWTSFPRMTATPTSVTLTPNTLPLPWTNLATSQCSSRSPAAFHLTSCLHFTPAHRLCKYTWLTIRSIYSPCKHLWGKNICKLHFVYTKN